MDIAVLDDRGVIREVRAVSEVDYRTDPAARTVALPPGHDMGQRLGQYAWDFLRQCFMPVPHDPLAAAASESPRLVEALVAVANQLHDAGVVTLSEDQRNAVTDWLVRLG